MAEASTNTWSLAGLKNAISGNKDNVSQEEKNQAAIHAAVREETKLKEERGESTSGWRSKVSLDVGRTVGLGIPITRLCGCGFR